MSAIAIGMNLLLAGLLLAALAMGWRLNSRLKALRDSHDGFARAVSELDAAAARAELGLADLRAATDEAADALADRIEKARALATKLERLTASAPAAVRDAPMPEAREHLGALLAAAREARPPRPEPDRSVRRPIVQRAPIRRLEDDLFDDPSDRAEFRAVVRGARR